MTADPSASRRACPVMGHPENLPYSRPQNPAGGTMIVDIYTHIFPERFFQELERGSAKLGNMGKRLRMVRKLFDLELRFKDMDAVAESTRQDYRQIISLPNPPIEDIAEGA